MMILRVFRNIDVNRIIGWVILAGNSNPFVRQAMAQSALIYTCPRIPDSLKRRVKVCHDMLIGR